MTGSRLFPETCVSSYRDTFVPHARIVCDARLFALLRSLSARVKLTASYISHKELVCSLFYGVCFYGVVGLGFLRVFVVQILNGLDGFVIVGVSLSLFFRKKIV